MRRAGVAVLIASGFLVGCGKGGSEKGGAADGSKGPTVAGEPFVVRVIADTQQGGMPVGAVVVPAKWNFESKVTWKYENSENPVTITLNTQNPANEEAVFGWGGDQHFNLRPESPYYRQGQSVGGLIYGRPMSALDTMVSFIKRTRGKNPKFQFAGWKDLPELPAALKMAPAKGQKGLGVKVTYDVNGKPVEEEFYGVYYSKDVPYDGPQGRTWQIYWGLASLHSFRAPVGTLEKRRPVFAAIAKSFKANPAWEQRRDAIFKHIADEFNRQLKAGYDQIAAAVAMSKAISANNDAMLAQIDRQLASSSTSSGGSGSRSSTDKFSDYIRGVDTTNDPYYGTSQHSSNEKFHWTDGYGNYRNTNEVTYDPNRTEVGNWTLMKNIR
jgi:hypothetical protein